MSMTMKQSLSLMPILLLGLACGKKAEETSQSVPAQPVAAVSDPSPAVATIPAFKSSLKDFETMLSEGMRLSSSEQIPDGPFKGFTKNVYKAGADASALEAAEVITRDGGVYRFRLIANKAVVDSMAASNPKAPVKDVLNTVYRYSIYEGYLYATAFNVQYKPETRPDELIKESGSYASMCVDNVHYKSGGAYYQVYNGYAFGCLNKANKTISFDVVSEDVYKAEKLERIHGGKS
ncbi:MAG: hypothetical protein A2X35_11650 [Elusimicrobia bacterium GWA2_61_42]|nr:MAG: hypothetical protein A2X35_11650 [Elusimicrobia bacterium GWA2_61_42]OGR75811.1 MAG: hypothetical protein A2X38_07265 [Elusimicrobia bacterium GWC2_61_25]